MVCSVTICFSRFATKQIQLRQILNKTGPKSVTVDCQNNLYKNDLYIHITRCESLTWFILITRNTIHYVYKHCIQIVIVLRGNTSLLVYRLAVQCSAFPNLSNTLHFPLFRINLFMKSIHRRRHNISLPKLLKDQSITLIFLSLQCALRTIRLPVLQTDFKALVTTWAPKTETY